MDDVRAVLLHPEQRWTVGEGRDVLQARVKRGPAVAAVLVRVFVDVDHIPPLVVTAYATSKVDKYWRSAP